MARYGVNSLFTHEFNCTGLAAVGGVLCWVVWVRASEQRAGSSGTEVRSIDGDEGGAGEGTTFAPAWVRRERPDLGDF